MNTLTPFQILLREDVSLSGVRDLPVFKSQQEIVTIIYESEYGKSFASEASLKTMLNRALRENRSFSKKLVDGILYAIIKVKDNDEAAIVKSLFLRAIKRKNKNRVLVTWEEFEEIRTTPGHHVIITDHPIEYKHTDASEKLTRLILESVGVIKTEGSNEKFRYEFYLKDEDVALTMWKNFFYYLTKKAGMDEKEARGKLYAAQTKTESLRIFYTAPFLAAHNLYLHSILRSDPVAIKTCNRANLHFRIPAEEIESIIENIYNPLRGTLKPDGLVHECIYGDDEDLTDKVRDFKSSSIYTIPGAAPPKSTRSVRQKF